MERGADRRSPESLSLSQRALYAAALIMSFVLIVVALAFGAFLMGATNPDPTLPILALVLLLLVRSSVGFGAIRSRRYLLAGPAYLLAGVACLPFGGGVAYLLIPAAAVAVSAMALSTRNPNRSAFP